VIFTNPTDAEAEGHPTIIALISLTYNVSAKFRGSGFDIHIEAP
jgi:hypothetical protein